RHQHQASRTIGQGRENRRQAELIESLDLLRDDSIDGRHGAALVENVAAETREAANAEREVEFERLLESLLLRIREHAVRQSLGFRGAERRKIERLPLARYPNLVRGSRRDVQIGSLYFDECL